MNNHGLSDSSGYFELFCENGFLNLKINITKSVKPSFTDGKQMPVWRNFFNVKYVTFEIYSIDVPGVQTSREIPVITFAHAGNIGSKNVFDG